MRLFNTAKKDDGRPFFRKNVLAFANLLFQHPEENLPYNWFVRTLDGQGICLLNEEGSNLPKAINKVKGLKQTVAAGLQELGLTDYTIKDISDSALEGICLTTAAS